MELYLMQHGPNLAKDQDPEEGLSPEGIEVVQAAAQALAKLGLTLDALVASPKKRAQETAALVAKAIGYGGEVITTKKVKAMAPTGDTLAFLAGLEGKKRVLIAGHLPSLALLASQILSAGQGGEVAFERGGVCRIDVEDVAQARGKLIWYLPPVITGLMTG